MSSQDNDTFEIGKEGEIKTEAKTESDELRANHIKLYEGFTVCLEKTYHVNHTVLTGYGLFQRVSVVLGPTLGLSLQWETVPEDIRDLWKASASRVMAASGIMVEADIVSPKVVLR